MNVMIIDDCSSDRTLEICEQYRARFPNQIQIEVFKENQFSRGGLVGIEFYTKLQTKYLAWCDGDDYWTDSKKIEKQIILMESKNNISIVHSDFKRRYESSSGANILNRSVEEIQMASRQKNGRDFIRGNQVKHSTAIISRDQIDFNFLQSATGIYAGDWLTCISALRAGTVAFLAEPTTIVRITDSGMWNGSSIARNSEQKERIRWFCAANLPDSRLRDEFRRAVVLGWARNQISESYFYRFIRPVVIHIRRLKTYYMKR